MNSNAEQDHHADKPRGIEEHPRHEESEDENETAVGAGLDRDPRPFVALEKFGIFLFFGPICDCPSASSIDISKTASKTAILASRWSLAAAVQREGAIEIRWPHKFDDSFQTEHAPARSVFE
jgi:hypothetical protein